MTFVLGVNLSDRIYLLADTRISLDGNPVADDQLKTIELNQNIIAGCSGNIDLLKAVVTNTANALSPTDGIDDILKKREELQKFVDDFFFTNELEVDERDAQIIFAGKQQNKPKRIPAGYLIRLTSQYEEIKKKKIGDLLHGRNPMQLPPDEMAKIGSLISTKRAGLKHSFLEALKKNDQNENGLAMPVTHTHLITCTISGGRVVFQEHGWGEVAMAGSGVEDGPLPEDFIMDLDINMECGDIDRDSLYCIARVLERYSATVGGAVTAYAIHDDVQRIDGTINFLRDGKNCALFTTKFENGLWHYLNKDHQFVPFRTLLHKEDGGSALLMI